MNTVYFVWILTKFYTNYLKIWAGKFIESFGELVNGQFILCVF